MTLERRQRDDHCGEAVVLTACPFCGEEFAEGGGEQRPQHLRECDET